MASDPVIDPWSRLNIDSTNDVVGTTILPMEIRRATDDDVAVLAELGAEVQALHHSQRPDWFKPPNAQDMEPLYAELLDDRSVTAYLAEDGPENPLGYVIARVIKRPETVLSWGATVVDIDQIGVTARARRQGVGEQLMRVVRSLAEDVDCDLLHLTVWDFNQPAQAFFRSQGLNLTMLRMTDR